MILTSDRSLLHVLERWPEGAQALDRPHCHTLTVLHSYHRMDLIRLRYSSVEFLRSKRRINRLDVRTFTCRNPPFPRLISQSMRFPLAPVSGRQGAEGTSVRSPIGETSLDSTTFSKPYKSDLVASILGTDRIAPTRGRWILSD